MGVLVLAALLAAASAQECPLLRDNSENTVINNENVAGASGNDVQLTVSVPDLSVLTDQSGDSWATVTCFTNGEASSSTTKGYMALFKRDSAGTVTFEQVYDIEGTTTISTLKIMKDDISAPDTETWNADKSSVFLVFEDADFMTQVDAWPHNAPCWDSYF